MEDILAWLEALPEKERIAALNDIKQKLHAVSPMKDEPTDCVLWVESDRVEANDYNPNVVAPPEMKLLHTSIIKDGYTQPIVTFPENGRYTVVDGFHRNRCGKEYKDIKARVKGYLPITVINTDREEKPDRIAATIRHNRARGTHQVKAMANTVVDLARNNWSDEKIGKELGMGPDEVLRLKQITGLAELFATGDFSEAWE
ncbi:MAG: ParB/RepB/Spo0J family partition protein [Treponema sp.]|nr:ParB/RepB/Spo0J family partition protein [Treponema sp.]